MPRRLVLAAGLAAALTGGLVVAPGAAAAPDKAQRAEQALRHAPQEVALDDSDSLVARVVTTDADGAVHVRFDRARQGVPVLGGDLVVHQAPDGSLRGVSATTRKALRLSLSPEVSQEEAARAAFSAAGNRPVRTDTPHLAVDSREEEQAPPRLVWSVTVFGTQADGTPSELASLVDAHSGRVVDAVEQVETAGDDLGLYNRSVALTTTASPDSGYTLTDASRGGNYTTDMAHQTTGNGVLFQSIDDTWGTDNDYEQAAVDAHFGAAQTVDYYRAVHSRDGIDGLGYTGYSRVHHGVDYNNAFWSASCRCMTSGDGDGTTFGPFLELDVAGHEMTHGVTQATSNLTYSGESGGLNEASSDILGTMVERFANASGSLDPAADPADYRVGEYLRKGARAAEPLRYMDTPSRDGKSADCWSSKVGRLDVHYSSGVANHFFYLLAEGSGTKVLGGVEHVSTTCNGTTVAGIGAGIAEKVWFRALTVEMTSRTNYAAARLATLAAAQYVDPGNETLSSAVAAAWSAVGVNATTTKGKPAR
jgi:Zn-dependent metalloprotease